MENCRQKSTSDSTSAASFYIIFLLNGEYSFDSNHQPQGWFVVTNFD